MFSLAGRSRNDSLVRDLLLLSPSLHKAVIDLARLLASTSPAFAAYSTASGLLAVDLLFLASDYSEPWQASKPRETNTMLALRAIANLFATANGRKLLGGQKAGEVCRQLTRHDWMTLGKNTRIAAATIALKSVEIS